jgi:hypothetical protein
MPFSTHFQEHLRDYIHGHNKSKFAEHLLHHHHSFGPTDTIMEPIHFTTKGRMMDTIERFYIYRKSKLNPLAPSDPYMGRTTQLTSRRCILNTYSTNTRTEYFKHAA